SEAKANPIITALTMMSAAMNMPQGDRSCGSVSDIAEGSVCADAPGWVAGCGAVGAACPAVGEAGATGAAGAGRSTATGEGWAADRAAAAGSVVTLGCVFGCSCAVALPADSMTAASAANKPFLDTLRPRFVIARTDRLVGDGMREHPDLDPENSSHGFWLLSNAAQPLETIQAAECPCLTIKHEFSSQQTRWLFWPTIVGAMSQRHIVLASVYLVSSH
ncbi:hypothetical protein, partial [Mesorhizobium sp. LSJC268A00]|uniref:hypothetical protein n=2 Tax=Mesorhizobium TaxID=68287 RepID=UPI0018DC49E2